MHYCCKAVAEGSRGTPPLVRVSPSLGSLLITDLPRRCRRRGVHHFEEAHRTSKQPCSEALGRLYYGQSQAQRAESGATRTSAVVSATRQPGALFRSLAGRPLYTGWLALLPWGSGKSHCGKSH